MSTPRPTNSGLWYPLEGTAIADLPDDLLREGVFEPHPLPSDLLLGSRTHRELASAEQALGRLDEAAERLSDRRALTRATQVRELQSSANLDNKDAALREVLLAELPGMPSASALTPILSRYLHASDLAFTAVRDGRPLNTELWMQISEVLGEHDVAEQSGPAAMVDDVLRQQPGWLCITTVKDAYLLTGPSPAATMAALKQLDAWMAAECALPLVGRLALGHYQLAALQPFRAGSGYLARLYVGLELVRAGVLREQILPISIWLNRARDQYREQIRRVVDTGTFTDWIEFFAGCIRETALDQVRLIKDLETARDGLLTELVSPRTSRIAEKVRQVASDLLATPITNHKQIAARHDLPLKVATEVAKRLLSMELIVNMDNKKYGKVFIVPAFMDLLTLNNPIPPARDRDAFAADPTRDTPRVT